MDLRKLELLLEEVAEIDKDMCIPALRTIIHVANNPGLSQKDCEDYMALSLAGISRNVSYWADIRGSADRRPGHMFIERREDPSDRRYRILSLTKKGKEFIEKLRAI